MSDSPTPQDSRSTGSTFGKFAGAGMQMLAIIGLSTWLGVWLDGRYHSSPWATVGLSLLGIFVALYQVIRAVSEKS
ncbi:AtpZ/AtpI family protein [Hymenobacter guriensis]|uniref:AtpZ/AtpI family protein n=1 Tax=Hymenobacter guriensis TaxID=2793065 RepID=A0ABS0KZB9_9BACT|nr:AtpZ/AtpI family protein [Hymenobacter guriensis]MBG8553205.1 AtpZ/AtpI family protein [Hymenobacter guriensis]